MSENLTDKLVLKISGMVREQVIRELVENRRIRLDSAQMETLGKVSAKYIKVEIDYPAIEKSLLEKIPIPRDGKDMIYTEAIRADTIEGVLQLVPAPRDGKDGQDGKTGENYVLKAEDRADIAREVLAKVDIPEDIQKAITDEIVRRSVFVSRKQFLTELQALKNFIQKQNKGRPVTAGISGEDMKEELDKVLGTDWRDPPPASHANLNDLEAPADDHTQYLLLDGRGGCQGIADDVCVAGKLGIGIDSPFRKLHLRGDIMQFDRDSPSAAFFFTRYAPLYTAVWKTFGIEVDATGVNSGTFRITDRGSQDPPGGASFASRFLIGNTGTIYFPSAFGQVVGGGTPVYMNSTGLIGTSTSLRAAKTNIKPLLAVDLSWFDELVFVRFNFRKKDKQGNYTNEAVSGAEFGGIAEDFEKINSDIVFYRDSEQIYNKKLDDVEQVPLDSPELRGINYEKLIPVMACKIQKLEKENRDLRQRLEVIEEMLAI